VEEWKNGRMEGWKDGVMEYWSNGVIVLGNGVMSNW
jgi:hypothetical protein